MAIFQQQKTAKLQIEKIAVLSVLKPVDDIRGYEKIAKSIVRENRKIILIGFAAANSFTKKNKKSTIDFVELFNFENNKNRLGLWRFFAGFKVFYQLLKIKPQKIIVCAIEILPFAVLFKVFFRSKLIYDVQENYVFNILYQKNYPKFFRKIIAFLIKKTEELSSYFVDLYLLAEQCYLKEIPFLRNKNYTFLENKFLIDNTKNFNIPTFYNANYLDKKEINFLIYGSFSKTYGTIEGILLFQKIEKELQKQGFLASLVLAGYCSDAIYTRKIIETINKNKSISIVNNSISKPVCHAILLKKIKKSDFVILPYLFNKSTQNCIPTKFYECLAYKKTMLVSKNANWEDFLTPLEVGVFIDFENDIKDNKTQAIVQKILYQKFYTNPICEKVWKFDRSIIKNVI